MLKTVKQALTGKNGSFKPVKIFEFYVILCRNQFFPCFHIAFPLFLACLQSFKGLSKHGRRSVDPRSRVCGRRSRPFLYFPHQNLFTDGQFGRSLVQHHQKIRPQYNFCSCKWKGYCRKPVLQHARALRCCATHGPRAEDLKGDSTHVEKKARRKKLQQRLGDLPAAVLPPVSPASSTYGRRCVWRSAVG